MKLYNPPPNWILPVLAIVTIADVAALIYSLATG